MEGFGEAGGAGAFDAADAGEAAEGIGVEPLLAALAAEVFEQQRGLPIQLLHG